MATWSPWASITAGVVCQLAAGTPYLFGVYAADLKEELGFSQSEILGVGTAGNAGLWLLLIGGMVFDAHGPRPTIRAGAVMIALGYGGLYLCARHGETGVALAALCNFVAGTGSSWVYVSSLLGNVKSFGASERGRVLGLLVCFFGCSAAVFTALYEGFFRPRVQPFLALLATAPPLLALAGSAVVTQAPAPAQDPAHFRRAFALTATLLVFLVSASLAGAAGGVLAAGTLALVAAVLVGLPWGTGALRGGRSYETLEEAGAAPAAPAGGLGPLRAARTPAFWTLFAIFGTGVGTAVTLMNNLGNLALARGSGEAVADAAMILLSVGNTFARVATGFVLDSGVTVGRALGGWMLLGAATSALLAAGGPIYVGALALGTVEGGLFCACPLALQALFGDRAYGANLGALLLGPTIGLTAISTVTGALYDARADAEGECEGDGCYGAAFGGMAVACLAAAAVGWRSESLAVTGSGRDSSASGDESGEEGVELAADI